MRLVAEKDAEVVADRWPTLGESCLCHRLRIVLHNDWEIISRKSRKVCSSIDRRSSE